MKFNSKYNVWVSKDGLVYCLKHGKLVLRTNNVQRGYVYNQTSKGQRLQHRIVWETFNGDIPDEYEVDHINDVRDDNRLCNLQLLTRLDNMRKAHKGRPKSSEQRAKTSLSLRGRKCPWTSEYNRTRPACKSNKGRKVMIVNGHRRYIRQEVTNAKS